METLRTFRLSLAAAALAAAGCSTRHAIGELTDGPTDTPSGQGDAPPSRADAQGAETPADPACKTDGDCLLVPDGCCDCNGCGKRKAIAARDKGKDDAERMAMCQDVGCLGCISNDPSCSAAAVCRAGACVLSISEDACFAAWKSPAAVVTAAARPAPAQHAGLDFSFSYSVSDAGVATIVLSDLLGVGVVQPSQGPFSAGVDSGRWVELQDRSGRTLYTRGESQLIQEFFEAPGPDGGFQNVAACPRDGVVRLTNYANDPAATQIVFFQEPIDGKTMNRTVELARFALPPIPDGGVSCGAMTCGPGQACNTSDCCIGQCVSMPDGGVLPDGGVCDNSAGRCPSGECELPCAPIDPWCVDLPPSCLPPPGGWGPDGALNCSLCFPDLVTPCKGAGTCNTFDGQRVTCFCGP